MRSNVVVIILALLALVVCLSSAHAKPHGRLLTLDGYYHGGMVEKRPWACCDKCMCVFSIPLQCRCQDVMRSPCHPNCKNCVRLSEDETDRPFYQCSDVIPFSCGPLCHPGQAQE